MSRDAIQLNPDKVRLLIARSQIPIKQLLEGMNEKTVHRIKAGKNTTWATAHKLATQLETTVEDLMSPVTQQALSGFLPDQWLYDETPAGAEAVTYRPFWTGIGGGARGYLIGPPPVEFSNPLEELMKWHNLRGKKIVLRQQKHAFIFEIYHFDYSGNREESSKCYFATACRFFPLARHGDIFSKAELSNLLHRYVWKKLKQVALDNSEIVAIEGYDYPAHPHAYFPLARFYGGTVLKRIALGAREFQQLHVDFKWSLVDYVESIGPRRVRATSTRSGIAIRVDAIRPANYIPDWEEDMLYIEVDLVWRTADGKLALAPWRKAYREEFSETITHRKWSEFNLRGMPLPRYPDTDDDDPAPPPFEPDRAISAATIAVINAIDRWDPVESLWEDCGDE